MRASINTVLRGVTVTHRLYVAFRIESIRRCLDRPPNEPVGQTLRRAAQSRPSESHSGKVPFQIEVDLERIRRYAKTRVCLTDPFAVSIRDFAVRLAALEVRV